MLVTTSTASSANSGIANVGTVGNKQGIKTAERKETMLNELDNVTLCFACALYTVNGVCLHHLMSINTCRVCVEVQVASCGFICSNNQEASCKSNRCSRNGASVIVTLVCGWRQCDHSKQLGALQVVTVERRVSAWLHTAPIVL
jgi:hypothetical protein